MPGFYYGLPLELISKDHNQFIFEFQDAQSCRKEFQCVQNFLCHNKSMFLNSSSRPKLDQGWRRRRPRGRFRRIPVSSGRPRRWWCRWCRKFGQHPDGVSRPRQVFLRHAGLILYSSEVAFALLTRPSLVRNSPLSKFRKFSLKGCFAPFGNQQLLTSSGELV